MGTGEGEKPAKTHTKYDTLARDTHNDSSFVLDARLRATRAQTHARAHNRGHRHRSAHPVAPGRSHIHTHTPWGI